MAQPLPISEPVAERPACPTLVTQPGGYAARTVTTSDGVRLAVRDYRSTEMESHTVVLMHGLCLSQDAWAIQVRHLLRRWGNTVRIITYDHRGHGNSTGASMYTYRVEQLAADLAEVLTALKVTGPLTLAGHSMGGMTALAYCGRPAQQRPVEPQGLVLIATAAGRLTERGLGRLIATPATGLLFGFVHRMPRAASDVVFKAMTRPVSDAMSRITGRANQTSHSTVTAVAARSVRRASLATIAGFLDGLKRYDQYHTLPSITATTIVVSGGTDYTTPDTHSYDLAAAIPGATHLHRPRAGHMLPQEAPHCVSAAINRAMGMRRARPAGPQAPRSRSAAQQLVVVGA